MTDQLEDRIRRHVATVDRAQVADVDTIVTASRRIERRLRARRRAVGTAAAVALVFGGAALVGWATSAEPEPAGSAATASDADGLVPSGSLPRSSPTSLTEPASTERGSTEPGPAGPPPAGPIPTEWGSTEPGPTEAPPTGPILTEPAPTGPAISADPSAWAPIAPDPRGVAIFPAVVWTGTEAIVLGGTDLSGAVTAGVAAYDPSTDMWRTLSTPPGTTPPLHPLTVWTGEEVLVVGGDNADGSLLVSSARAYHPATDTWSVRASPPIGFVSDRSPSVWTGTELLVWPWDGGGPTMHVQPIAYDPVADSWRVLAMPPIARRQQAASVWTGTEWIVWGGTSGDVSMDDGARFDPATNQWHVLAESPLSARRVRGVWTGAELIVDAGSTGGDPITGNGELALADGAAYDPATDSWRSITAGLAHPGFVPIWTGTHVAMFAKGGVVVYDVAGDDWVDTCCSDGGSGGGGAGATPVWTGSVVLLVGSATDDAGGATFTPPGTSTG